MRSFRLPLVAMMTMALLGGLGGAGLAQDGDAPPDPVAATEANEAANQAAFLAQDFDAFMATYADDVVYEDLTFGDRLEGAPAIREMYQTVLSWTDPDATELDGFVSADGSRAVQVLRWKGTSSVTGRPFDLPTLVLHEYRDGRIVKESLYYAAPDTTTQLMGVPPAE